jgi:hypothetical protein
MGDEMAALSWPTGSEISDSSNVASALILVQVLMQKQNRGKSWSPLSVYGRVSCKTALCKPRPSTEVFPFAHISWFSLLTFAKSLKACCVIEVNVWEVICGQLFA